MPPRYGNTMHIKALFKETCLSMPRNIDDFVDFRFIALRHAERNYDKVMAQISHHT
jgi:hypothetical protein